MKLVESNYTGYDLTDTEFLQGQVLTQENRAYFKNLLVSLLTSRINLTVDPNDIMSFVQTEAELKGQILLLESILDDDLEAKNTLLEQAKAAAQQQ